MKIERKNYEISLITIVSYDLFFPHTGGGFELEGYKCEVLSIKLAPIDH